MRWFSKLTDWLILPVCSEYPYFGWTDLFYHFVARKREITTPLPVVTRFAVNQALHKKVAP